MITTCFIFVVFSEYNMNITVLKRILKPIKYSFWVQTSFKEVICFGI